MRCVREEGHEGPCAWEPAPTMTVVVGPTDIPSFTTHEQLDEAFGKGSLGRAVGVEGPIAEPRTPEQIAASDARYRAHLLRRQRAR